MLYNVTYQVEFESIANQIQDLPTQSVLSVVAMNCFRIGCTASCVSVDGTNKYIVTKSGKVISIDE